MDRVVVIGSSGSGKTTVARRLAGALETPLLEMDSLFHRDGWDSTPDDEFRETLDEFTNQSRWVADGNYTSHGSRDIVWPKADTIVWLDLPRRVVIYRVVKRTLRRVITREVLWGRVREPWTNLYKLNAHQNIIVWAWTRHRHVREKYEQATTDGSWQHATVHRLMTVDQIDRLISSIEERQN